MANSTRKERRASERQRRRLKVRLWNDELEGTGFTAEVSRTGLRVETDATIEAGARLHVELTLPDGSAFFAEALTVRKKKYPRHARSVFRPSLALEFLRLDECLDPEEREAPAPEPKPLRVDLRTLEALRSAYEKDIKHGGLLVPCDEKPELDSELRVPVLLPEPHGEIECAGTVVRVNENSFALRLTEVDMVRARVLEIIR